jgi:hypothetical protein
MINDMRNHMQNSMYDMQYYTWHDKEYANNVQGNMLEEICSMTCITSPMSEIISPARCVKSQPHGIIEISAPLKDYCQNISFHTHHTLSMSYKRLVI